MIVRGAAINCNIHCDSLCYSVFSHTLVTCQVHFGHEVLLFAVNVEFKLTIDSSLHRGEKWREYVRARNCSVQRSEKVDCRYVTQSPRGSRHSGTGSKLPELTPVRRACAYVERHSRSNVRSRPSPDVAGDIYCTYLPNP